VIGDPITHLWGLWSHHQPLPTTTFPILASASSADTTVLSVAGFGLSAPSTTTGLYPPIFAIPRVPGPLGMIIPIGWSARNEIRS